MDGKRVKMRHPGPRRFEDPGVLRLRQSAWGTWGLYSRQWHKGQACERAPEGTRRPRARADEAELSRLMEELGI